MMGTIIFTEKGWNAMLILDRFYGLDKIFIGKD